MSSGEIAILALIIAVFFTFGALLASLTWYCGDKRKRAVRRAGRRDYRYPTGGKLIADDD